MGQGIAGQNPNGMLKTTSSRWWATVVAVAVAIGGVTYWVRTSQDGPPFPHNSVTDSVSFDFTPTGAPLDGWAADQVPTWRSFIERYLNGLHDRSPAEIAALIHPGDSASLAAVGGEIAKYGPLAVPGISVQILDFQPPDYSSFCVTYPDGEAQGVFVSKGYGDVEGKNWAIVLLQGELGTC
jgi:hypothetical protein